MDVLDGYDTILKMSFEIKNRRYTGSKTKIIPWIRERVLDNCKECKSFSDLFAGTGVVTASFVNDFKIFHLNDFLFSNEIIYYAFFSKEVFDMSKLISYKKNFNNIDSSKINENYVSINYGGKYFEMSDSLKIGYIRSNIEENKGKLNKREYSILISSLLYSLDKCANTVGHYDAFFKQRPSRSLFEFDLINPIIYKENDLRLFNITRSDANIIAKSIHSDIFYLDPPYSSRQYSRFYHVLENITKWDKPKLFGVALKPEPENLSKYSSSSAFDSFSELVFDLNCKYIVVSYNNTYNSKSKSSENKMKLEDIEKILSLRGKTKSFSVKHNAFNAGKTSFNNHQEYLFITKVQK
jgi:adenine-specific DNA-methyltransferase